MTINTSGDGVVRGAGPDCRGACTVQVAAGQQLHLTANPDVGAPFQGWSGACTGTGTCDVTLDVDRTVTATFGRQPPPPAGMHRLNVVVQGTGRVVSAPPGIDCGPGASCTTTLPDGTGVTLTQTPGPGGSFAGWVGACTGTSTCSFVLSSDASVSASFSQPPPPPAKATLTVAVTGGGVVNGTGINCGSGATSCSTTVDSGTTVTLTASPNAHVRFMGWGGACSGSAPGCTVTVKSNTAANATFADEVTVIAGNDGRNQEYELALNSTQVFFAKYSYSEGWQIWSAPKAGGDAKKIASAASNFLVADDQYLYWTDGTQLFSMPVAGGAISPLGSHPNIARLALDGDGALYYISNFYANNANNWAVYRMQNRTETVPAFGQSAQVLALAVDATTIWFSTRSLNSPYDGVIHGVPKAGGVVTDALDCGSCQPGVLRVDSKYFYYRDQVGQTYSRGKSGGTLMLLSSPNGSGSGGFLDLDVNASVAWWNWDYSQSTNGVFHANSDGTGWAALDSNGTDWGALRVDDTAVYYFHGGTLIRRLK